MRLLRLHIQGFRGTLGSLALDLRSPVTLIYAPNGTGKTTVCDAAEWLLTAQVERLRDTQHFRDDVLLSKFAPGQEPLVTASLLASGHTYFLQRTRRAALFGASAETAQPILTNDLLSRLAPTASTQTTHHITAIALRQNWLRGTRFLSSEALASLVDTDPDTLERRKQVFADLLGIRHLVDAEDKLQRYSDALEVEERAAVRQFKDWEDSILSRRAAIAAMPRSFRPALEDLEHAERLLQIPAPADSVQQRLEVAASSLARQQYDAARIRQALDLLTSGWSRLALLRSSIAKAQEAKRISSQRLTELDGAAQRHNDTNRSLSRELSSLEFRLAHLSESRDALLPILSQLASRVSETPANVGVVSSLPIEALRLAIPEAAWSPAARHARWILVRTLAQEALSLPDRHRRLDSLESRIGALQSSTPSSEGLTALNDAVSKAEHSLANARSQFRNASEPVQRLQEAAREFLQHRHDVSACPLCGHDWHSYEDLSNRIAVTLQATPALLQSFEEAIRAASISLDILRARRDAALQELAELRALVDDREHLKAELSTLDNQVSMLGSNIPDVDLDQHLAILDDKLALATILAEFDAELASRRLPASDVLPEHTLLSEAYATCRQHFSVLIEDLQRRKVTLTADRAERETQSRHLEAEIAAERVALQEIQDRISQSHADLQRFEAAWTAVAQSQEMTDAALIAINQNLEHDTQRLEEAEQHLVASRAAADVEEQRRHIAEDDQTLARFAKREASLRRKQEAADRMIATLRQHYSLRSQQQLEDLSRTVNALFSRMQANKIFDRIYLGEGDSFLHWLAGADESRFSPTLEFSQGQRQDLALSIFLARARTVLGTFFLDEPLTHLDDLNRVGLLDVLRAGALEGGIQMGLVLTTANRVIARHFVEKFGRIPSLNGETGPIPVLRIVELRGNTRTGIESIDVFPQSGTGQEL